jgi:hypothetical protein
MIELGGDPFLKQGDSEDDLCPLDIFLIRFKSKERIASIMKCALVDAWTYAQWISLGALDENSFFSYLPEDCRNVITKIFFTVDPYIAKIEQYSSR